jgi:hypothetical protein
MVGRDLERGRIDDFVADVGHHTWSLALLGESGIGKTTLWSYAVDRCRSAGVRVLTARPTEDDRYSAGQGLLDLFDDLGDHRDGVYPKLKDEDVALLDRCRQVLELLRDLAAAGPVVVAIDDLPVIDAVTQRVLRFALRRLVDEPVALLVTAREWNPRTTPGSDLASAVELLELAPMESTELRRVISAAVPKAKAAMVTQAVDLAHGNPFFAIELARSRRGSISVPEDSPLAALSRRIANLPRDAVLLARLLATAGPSPLAVLATAAELEHLDTPLRTGLDADMFVLEPNFVLRFSHPLLSTVVLAEMNTLDRQAAHAALAEAVPDPDVRAVHLAQAVIGPDAEAAGEVEAAAGRLARRGAPRVAAELLGHSARLTPPEDQQAFARRALAEMMQWASAGELNTALQLADGLLRRLEPGRLRAEVITGRVVLDLTDAEQVLRSALEEVRDGSDVAHERLRGRLLGLLGWLLAIHLGRVAEGLEHARSGLAIGRAHGDHVLVAQAASTVSTACLLLGERADELMAEAVTLGSAVVSSQLAMWPAVLQGRQQLWDGRLAEGRANLETMYRRALSNGTECQRPYRLCDPAQAALAAGELDLAEQHAEEGLEVARDSGDEQAISWLAYPRGLTAAMRGDAGGALQHADRLDWWSARTGERPRHAMAFHIRGLLDAAGQDWLAGLENLLAGMTVLDDMGYVHPGPIPVLPQAIQLGTLLGSTERVAVLHDRLRLQCAELGSPWADAQLASATGQLALLRDETDRLRSPDRCAGGTRPPRLPP